MLRHNSLGVKCAFECKLNIKDSDKIKTAEQNNRESDKEKIIVARTFPASKADNVNKLSQKQHISK